MCSGGYVDQPNLTDVGVFFPVGFTEALSDEATVRRDARTGDAFELERFVKRRSVLGLCVKCGGED